MPLDTSTPTVGARCLASPDGYWTPGRIHRVNEDGTYTIELENKHMTFMPYWFGVTPEQISVNDESHWPTVFARLTAGASKMTRSLFANALQNIGYRVDDDGFRAFWEEQCKELFGIEDDPTDAMLNLHQTYRLLLRAGASAKRLDQSDKAECDYYKLYWNQTRMAGRQSSDINRTVTLDDAFDALGISQPAPDVAWVGRLVAFENANAVQLPPNLRRFLSCSEISNAVVKSHPNNPHLVLPGDRDCEFRRDPPLGRTGADYALTIMVPHQGNHVWAAVFNRGDNDASVYVTWDEDHWVLTAPTIGFFFWDLAQTGLIWYQNTGHDGGRPIRKTNIGVAPKDAG